MHGGLTILCDLDSTVLDMYPSLFALYNAAYNDDLTVARCVDWDMTRVVKPECGARVYELLDTPGLFLGASPVPGAVETLAGWAAAGHEIYIMSDCFFPRNADEKIRWCAEHLPFVPRDHVIMGAPKHLVRADVFVDDSPGQVRRYRAAWDLAVILTVGAPYNREVREIADVYADDGYEDPVAAWRSFDACVKDLDATRPAWARVPRASGSSTADAAGHFGR